LTNKIKTTHNSTLASVFFEEKKPNAKLQTVIGQCKKPTAQVAHLVLPQPHKPTHRQNQKSHFLATHK